MESVESSEACCDFCDGGPAPALFVEQALYDKALVSYDIERARADLAERQLRVMTARCGSFEGDVERYIRENAAQREQIQELRTALRAMAHLVAESEAKARARVLAALAR